MPQIRNAIFSVDIDARQGRFSIRTNDEKFPALENIRVGCTYALDGRIREAIAAGWQDREAVPVTLDTVEHGTIDTLVFHPGTDSAGITTQLTIGIVQEYPLVIWKMKVVNQGNQAVELEKIELLHLDSSQEGSIKYDSARSAAELGFYSNGWQSWSPSRWYRADDRMVISRQLLQKFQHPMIYNTGTPQPHKNGVFSSDMFAVIGDRKARAGFLIGFLSQVQQFGSILKDFNRGSLEMWANGDHALLNPGMETETDWAVFNPVLLDHRDPLDKYLDAVARENHVHAANETPVGWCSWYHFYQNVTAKNIEENLQTILEHQDRLPIQLVQIDDGFENQVGDWFTFKPTFPVGVAPLAEKITREGLIPGLWLAPFVVHQRSRTFKLHPDWILRASNGKPVNAGFGWGTFFTALDLTVPEALDYACRVVRTASEEWGFSYLKLDFLYAAALDGCYRDSTCTRAQVMRLGMEAIRNAVGPRVTLLGCGGPLGSMLGLVDAMRIGPDVCGHWEPHFGDIGILMKNEPSVPSTRNSIHNVLARANLHQRWWVNDPDCLLIRPDTQLSIDEVRSLATSIAITGGSMLLSDDLPKLPEERLEIAEALIPVINERPRVLDWFDSSMPSRLRLDLVNETGEWHVLAAFNWHDQPLNLVISTTDFQLVEGNYLLREFWTGKLDIISENSSLAIYTVPAHGCILLAARRLESDKPVYVGSTIHFSQGMEAAEWKADDEGIQMTLRIPRKASGEVIFRFPGMVRCAEVNGTPAPVREVGINLYAISVAVDGFAHVTISK